MDYMTLKLLSSALLPPFSLLLLCALGLVLLCIRRAGGFTLLAASIAGLAALSVPAVGTALVGLLEHRYSNQPARLEGNQAIVILGAGSYAAAPEYRGDTVAAATLARMRWGARLHRQTGLPIMVSGGSPGGTRTSEAEQMKAALEEDFHTPVKWTENKSLNTWESAQYAKLQLADAKVYRIVLVTHALHMLRARLAFEQAGFSVSEAPTVFSTFHPPGILDFLPCPEGLELSHAFVHEIIGLGWYHALHMAKGR
jgi:uncharacterized SAM-binding protein YcdF (DUF218 family)